MDGGNISNERKEFRAEGTGRGRGGINPSPGTGVKGFSNHIAEGLHALRPKGLGGFR